MISPTSMVCGAKYDDCTSENKAGPSVYNASLIVPIDVGTYGQNAGVGRHLLK